MPSRAEHFAEHAEGLREGRGGEGAEALDEALAVDGAELVEDHVAVFAAEAHGDAQRVGMAAGAERRDDEGAGLDADLDLIFEADLLEQGLRKAVPTV